MTNNNTNGLILILVFFMLFGFFTITAYRELDFKITKAEKTKEERIKKTQYLLDFLDLEAKAVYVYDFSKNAEIYAKNPEMVLPLASLTKLVSVPLATKTKPKEVVIKKDAIKNPGDEKLIVDDVWESHKIGEFALMTSSNDATEALVNGGENFVEEMNNRAKRFMAQKTIFYNATGLDIDDTHPGALGTAKDVSFLAYFALHTTPDLFDGSTKKEKEFYSKKNIKYIALNTNIVIEQIPNVLLSKTGYTNLAGGNLVIIFKNKNQEEIGVTILGSSYKGRFEDMVKLVNVLYNT